MIEGTSPASSGPAGSHFEGKVGASYLLSLLVQSEPRGLPGTNIDRVAFQRASEGHPLDDVILDAHDALGKPAVLEVQVKRTITFAPTDLVFRSVVHQIAKASGKPEFLNSRYELALATSRTSQKIGAYQDVLTWARELGDAATFGDRINRPGSANDNMRAFVKTFRSHLREDGMGHNDQEVWEILRKLRILVFDYPAQGSISEELAKERAVRALHADDSSRAGQLWAVLTELAIQIGSSGGDCTRERLIEELRQKSFRLASDRHHFAVRTTIAENARHALADIGDRIAGTMLTRHERIAKIRESLDHGRYVEIRGDAGVGKSAVIKHLAQQISTEAQVIVLSPNRTIPREWASMRALLGFEGSARELLAELASDGGSVLFLDSLEFFTDEQRPTVVDLVRDAATVPGMAVVATARRDFGVVEPSWLPAEAIERLGQADPVVIDELSDSETEELRSAAPQLKALLADDHPARPVARNLFRLSRLANRPANAKAVRTEAEMAEHWWQTADGDRDSLHRDRARVLRHLAEQSLDQKWPLDVSGMSSAAVATAHAIRHEIHRPAFVRLTRRGLNYRATPADPPPLSNPHHQSFLAIQPVHPLMVRRHAFA